MRENPPGPPPPDEAGRSQFRQAKTTIQKTVVANISQSVWH